MIIIEVLLVISAFIESFWLGIFVLIYVIYVKGKYAEIKNRLDTYLEENKNLKIKYNKIKCRIDTYLIGKRRDKTKNNKPMPDWDSIADEIYPYKRCTIIRYDKRFVIIMPDGERLNKVFNSLEEAKEVIDERK